MIINRAKIALDKVAGSEDERSYIPKLFNLLLSQGAVDFTVVTIVLVCKYL